jgi:chromatin structure-remodeling complex subunit RSC3/30
MSLGREILGVIFTYLAMGSLMCDDISGPALLARQKYSHSLTHASNLCVSFCDRAESLNDPLIWLLHSNAVLLTLQYGEAHHGEWQRLGDLASSVYAMGLHIDSSNQPKLPFFLGELRRGSFAAAYSTDKSISTFLGRPPRISIRYSSCRPPYDLTDEELMAPPEVRERAIAALDPAGWNRKGLIYRQTYARIKHMNSVIREEALELSLGPPAPEPEQKEKAQ